MITATERADWMALQIFIAAKEHNGRVVTHDLVDAVMSRDYAKECGKANKENVRRIIRKRAESEGVRVIFTNDERYWAIREQLHHMTGDQVHALRDEISEGGDDDPRAWDRGLINAISVRLSNRISPARLWGCKPVSIRLWSEPRRPAADITPRALAELVERVHAARSTDPGRNDLVTAFYALEDARDALSGAHTAVSKASALRQAGTAMDTARTLLQTTRNFTAFAAYAAADAALRLRPEDLTRLARHLPALAPATASPQRRALVPAHTAVEDATAAVEAADTLEGLAGVQASKAAHDQAYAAIDQARAAILAIEPTAKQMRGTDMPVTPDAIRAAARAYLAVNGHPEELTAIDTGTPTVQVWCRSSGGLGREVIAIITAGVRADIGHIPAHPPIVLRFRRLDGRLNAAENARRLLWRATPAKRYLRVEDVPVEFLQDSRV
ncbi:hypothetical protein SSP531S_58590 [Streptomyces spongiicola]|uniref:Uncharacterized protein n=1 Tax=Streptomyces spongiicola TaxID=1690221 RepID=A0A388T9D8_9ACTN|nr:hypothetical protein [Streptomyces spongiicola]GBQ04365.1 hypothetical protein SSP531S_58590 [Streptomyces spongiicola]